MPWEGRGSLRGPPDAGILGAMRIELADERKAKMVTAIQSYFAENLDYELGDLGADLLLEFFTRELGAPVYNQAIRDAHDFLQEKLIDLSGEFYEPETE
jgi:uncharacterized protein (DUF2164 family)